MREEYSAISMITIILAYRTIVFLKILFVFFEEFSIF